MVGWGVTSSDFPPREERNSISGRGNSAARQMVFVRNRVEVGLAAALLRFNGHTNHQGASAGLGWG